MHPTCVADTARTATYIACLKVAHVARFIAASSGSGRRPTEGPSATLVPRREPRHAAEIGGRCDAGVAPEGRDPDPGRATRVAAPLPAMAGSRTTHGSLGTTAPRRVCATLNGHARSHDARGPQRGRL